MGSKHPNINFNILFYPQYQDDDGKIVCHPGSVFEGIVQVKVTQPMPVHHIKLVFKASGKKDTNDNLSVAISNGTYAFI